MLRTKQGKSRNVQVLSCQVGSAVTMVLLSLYIENSRFCDAQLVSVHSDSPQQRILSAYPLQLLPVQRLAKLRCIRFLWVWKFPKKSKRFQKMLKQSSFKLLGLPSRKICQASKNLSALSTEAAQLDPHWQIAFPTQSSYNQSTESPGELQAQQEYLHTWCDNAAKSHKHLSQTHTHSKLDVSWLPNAWRTSTHQLGVMTLMGI